MMLFSFVFQLIEKCRNAVLFFQFDIGPRGEGELENIGFSRFRGKVS